MRFRCERDMLVDALTTAGRAVSARSAVTSAASGVWIEVQGDRLTLIGTDLDLTLRVEVEAVGLDDGVCVAPARLVADIVRAMEPGAVTMSVIEDDVEITAGRSRFVVRTYNANDFPVLPEHATKQVSLAVDDLVEGLRQVVPAASADSTRPTLTGVLIVREASGLRLVATDSYRLAWRDLPSGVDLPVGTEQILVPARALTELQRLLVASAKSSGARSPRAQEAAVAVPEAAGSAPTLTASASEMSPDGGLIASAPETNESGGLSTAPPTTIGFSSGELDATFWVDGVQVTTRLLDGQFPNYRVLVPPHHATSVRVAKQAMIEALRRMKLLIQDATTPVRLAMSDHGIDLSVMSQEVGRADETVDARVEGEEVVVAFNPSYLIDGVDAVVGDEVVMDILDATKPAILRSPEREDYRYLIMPVRVS